MSIRTITNINQINQKDWENFVHHHPNGNPFQSPQFYNFLSRQADFEPLIISAWNDNILKGILLAYNQKKGNRLKGFFSKRTIVYGGPLLQDNQKDEVFNCLITELNKQSNSIYTEFRNLFSLDTFKNQFQLSGFQYNPHLNNIVSIPAAEEKDPIQILNSSKRRQVRKSLKSGAKIIVPRGKEDIKAFYDILKKLYKEKVKKPLPEWSFFEEFYNREDLGKYLLIQQDENIIGGIMCPIFKDTIYEWYIAGLDGKIKNVYPSVLATYAPIEYAANNGLKYFDFMGAGKPGQDYGVREFKSKFGGKELENGRFVRINNKILYSIGRMGLKILSLIN